MIDLCGNFITNNIDPVPCHWDIIWLDFEFIYFPIVSSLHDKVGLSTLLSVGKILTSQVFIPFQPHKLIIASSDAKVNFFGLLGIFFFL